MKMSSPYDSVDDPIELVMSEPCPACGAPISTLGLALLAEVVCPACGNTVTVRTRLGHFRLIKKLGSGGMGSAYRAYDEQLGREVALKVLHREISGSEEEQRKLAEEARRTALINHPNVVKVFNYGSANGQFFLAMELVPNGSLDDLITLQGRVPEMQVLNVAIQIASGLKAAQEVGLIHRDIKPGNILFADAHTAKLVDFGLALVMDEVAAQKGEIWGTPYYVAPEKLDGRDEDFRSDMYSLGGTIFHALAGRPPYEAETASMVALKQLQSHVVNLQSFAPDVSDETNYIVNRMMAKNPDDRYQSYDELIEHLQYARQKLAERLRNPTAVRNQPIQLESTEQKKATTLILLSVIGGLFLLVLFGYLNRARIAEALGLQVEILDSSLAKSTNAARQQAISGNLQSAIDTLNAALRNPNLPQPDKNWALLQLGIFYLLHDDSVNADKIIRQLRDEGLFSEDKKDEKLANFFPNMANFLLQKRRLSAGTLETYKQDDFEAFAYFVFGINNWYRATPTQGAEILETFLKTDPKGKWSWIAKYKPLAEAMVADAHEIQTLQETIRAARSPEQAKEAIAKIQESRKKLKTAKVFENKFNNAIKSLEKQIR